jgi:hypothetical protein
MECKIVRFCPRRAPTVGGIFPTSFILTMAKVQALRLSFPACRQAGELVPACSRPEGGRAGRSESHCQEEKDKCKKEDVGMNCFFSDKYLP